jgi:hypothetical protein
MLALAYDCAWSYGVGLPTMVFLKVGAMSQIGWTILS